MFTQNAVMESGFLGNINMVRNNVREVLNAPASAAGAISLLQSVLAAEIACVRRYTAISVSPEGLRNGRVGAEFSEQARDERAHMDVVAERIEELGGVPDFFPELAPEALDLFRPGEDGFVRLLAENLAAEQSVIAHYRDVAAYLGRADQKSAAMMDNILCDEEEHTGDMRDLLASCWG